MRRAPFPPHPPSPPPTYPSPPPGYCQPAPPPLHQDTAGHLQQPVHRGQPADGHGHPGGGAPEGGREGPAEDAVVAEGEPRPSKARERSGAERRDRVGGMCDLADSRGGVAPSRSPASAAKKAAAASSPPPLPKKRASFFLCASLAFVLASLAFVLASPAFVLASLALLTPHPPLRR